MKTGILTIELHGWWHAGSGLGRGGDVDALVIRKKEPGANPVDDLPFLPGRTVKGLVRDAARLAEDYGRIPDGFTDEWFGMADPTTPNKDGTQAAYEPCERRPGKLCFSSATLAPELKMWILAGGRARQSSLYSILSSTALNENGVVADGTLRTIEVAPPLQLTAEITSANDGWISYLQECVKLVRALGSHRHRGLGRCTMRLESVPVSAEKQRADKEVGRNLTDSGCLWLEIELLTDIMISARAATTGGHESLQYLPGSVLLGAAAAKLFVDPDFGPDIFLSGKVRFGDGMPLQDGQPGWPVPLNIQRPKIKGAGRQVNGLTDTKSAADARTRDKQQVQQLRSGHLTLGIPEEAGATSSTLFHLEGNYLLKTTLDRESFGRAQDRQLFEYDTLPSGACFLSALRWDSRHPDLNTKVKKILEALTAPGVRLGRSRSAEFGQVKIKVLEDPPSQTGELTAGVVSPDDGAIHTQHFYAASDLCFRGPAGGRFSPESSDFGLSKDWKFLEARSFLRTRRYSPWNAFHHCRMTERQVITRGSIITFYRKHGPASDAELAVVRKRLQSGVGEFTN